MSYDQERPFQQQNEHPSHHLRSADVGLDNEAYTQY